MNTGQLPQTARTLLVASSVMASSLLIHVAILRPTPWFEWLALASLAFLLLCVGIAELRWRAWLSFICACVALWLLVRTGGARFLLYLPSILVPAGLAWFFGRSLRAGRRPLIAIIAVAAQPALPDYLVAYAGKLTVMWTAIFALLTISDLCLALLAPHAWWSLMANFVNYLLIGAVLVGEYLFRRLRFRDHQHPGFREYLKIVARANPRRLGDA
jgi:uncharacterized membrane protein